MNADRYITIEDYKANYRNRIEKLADVNARDKKYIISLLDEFVLYVGMGYFNQLKKNVEKLKEDNREDYLTGLKDSVLCSLIEYVITVGVDKLVYVETQNKTMQQFAETVHFVDIIINSL